MVTRHGLLRLLRHWPVKKQKKRKRESGFELRLIIAERKNTRAGACYDHASASSIRDEPFNKLALCMCVSVCKWMHTASVKKLLAVILTDKLEWKNLPSLQVVDRLSLSAQDLNFKIFVLIYFPPLILSLFTFLYFTLSFFIFSTSSSVIIMNRYTVQKVDLYIA